MTKTILRYIHYYIIVLLMSSGTLWAQKPIEYVNPLVGTGYHGHTYPGASLPFGGVQLSPDTRRGNWDACSGYHYSDSTLFGFSHTHLSGTGCIDLGDILFRPTSQHPDVRHTPLYRPASFRHSEEQARPGYYRVRLIEDEIDVELTTTMHCGLHRYTYSDKKEQYIIIDLAHLLDNEHIYEAQLQQISPSEIVGMRRTSGWVDNQSVYFCAQFSRPIESREWIGGSVQSKDLIEGQKLQAVLKFISSPQPLEVRVGVSLVSTEEARRNLKEEVGTKRFDRVRVDAERIWNQRLGQIVVQGGTREEQENFYTALYHAMLAPNAVSDASGAYRTHKETIAQLSKGDRHYSTLSTWDTFRAWHPLMTLLDTTLTRDIVASALRMYDDTGELPLWPLASGETNTMIGYHTVSIIADAYLRGIRGFDAEKALEAMVVSAEKNAKGADYYIHQGFIPSNIKRESVSCQLEFAYDDWCIAQMAKAMQREDIYSVFINRSQSYKNVFDGYSKFFRGKRADGGWETPFDPTAVGRAYTEATAWQYRFFIPHDVTGLVNLMGGRDAFVAALDSLFDEGQTKSVSFQDITGLLGHYAHGNEPSHHMAYLYSYVGQPEKTQELTRRLLGQMYQPTPEGIIGNEDCGQMSAWYIFSALGFYPVCPGSGQYILTSPIFPEAELRLANGRKLRITANEPAKNTYIKAVYLNDREITQTYITYDELASGGELRFVLTPKPEAHRLMQKPYSYTDFKQLSVPYVIEDLYLFEEKTTATLGCATQLEGIELRYTIDGSEPTEYSELYTAPLLIDRSVTLSVRAYAPNHSDIRPSAVMRIEAKKAEKKASVELPQKLQRGLRYRYYEGKCKHTDEILNQRLVSSGLATNLSLSLAQREDHYGLIFDGYIMIPEDGVYTFQTKSDDGSRLLVDGEVVVNNDGSHASITASGRIALKQGLHRIELRYFEDYEGEELSWQWTLPGKTNLVDIPDEVLFF